VFAVAATAILKVVVLPAYDNHTVTEALPVQVRSTDTPSTGTSTTGTSTTGTSSTGTSSTGTPAAAAQPAKVKSAELRGIDHRASGRAVLYVAPAGRVIIGLEQFDIQPGPAYVLYMVRGADRRDHDGGTRIEPLRGNKGTQFYDAPSSADITSGEWTVLVWCETFDVPVANATPIAV
jgi:hypothetical protein